MVIRADSTPIDTVSLTKRLMGRAWLPRDDAALIKWIRDHLHVLNPGQREAMALYLDGIYGQQAAQRLGIERPTYYGRHREATQILRAILQREPESVKQRLFRSIYDHVFSERVGASELSEALLGHRSNLPQLDWLFKVREQRVDLPVPQKEGRKYWWTREEANAWRDAYAMDLLSTPQRGSGQRSLRRGRVVNPIVVQPQEALTA